MTLVIALGLGLVLGVVTGMPLGVVNVAIVDAAAAGRRQFATGIGLGGGIADTVHSALAFVGIAGLVSARPELVRLLAVLAAILIGTYAIYAWRRHTPARTSSAAPAPATDPARVPADRIGRGVIVGMSLTLPNPAPLAAWGAIAASLWPSATIAEAACVAVGVGIGSATWFALLARLIARIRPDHPALRIVPRVALVALMIIALVGLTRML